MARNLFGGTADSVAEDITGARVPNAVGTVWSGPSAGASQLTDLTDISGAPLLQLQADASGFVAPFYGPDGYERLWVNFGGGRVALVSVTVGDRLNSHLSTADAHGDRAYTDSSVSAAVSTHNAATKAHGINGAVVGTTDTQTLTNKTLNGGALSGTFSGAHTLSGAVSLTGGGTLTGTFSGAHTLSGALSLTGGASFTVAAPSSSAATSSTAAYRAGVVGEGSDRIQIKGSGLIEIGDGTGSRDTNIYRGGSNVLATDDQFRVQRVATTDAAFSSQLAADTNARFYTATDGKHFWGTGTAAQDTNLYRSGVGALQTDGNLVVGGELTVVGPTTWTSYVPVVTNAGSATWSHIIGWYKKIGKIVLIEVYLSCLAAGSGTTNVTVSLPSTPLRDGDGAASTRQILPGYASGMVAGTNTTVSGSFTAVCLAGGSGAVIDQLRGPTDIPVRGENVGASTVMTFQGWYREA
ncbi:hypothetical protein ACFYW9_19250 [Streptomyces sp. NPDC002698]|uniref:hypothetical protein n=1 Tax=Streptomyces sp. NPDC002698 TaxID=3364660 RepID=UPI0036AFCB81